MKNWSLTSLSTYERCGFKYKLKYVERIPEIRSMQASRGVDFHRSVENFLTGAEPKLPPELDFYTEFLTGLKQHEIYPEHKVSLSRDWNPTTWEDGWFRGVLDLKLIPKEQNQTGFVYDWKTGKPYPDHDDQKTLYSIALFAEQPTLRSVRAVHVYFDSRRNIQKEFHKDQVHSLRQQWESRVQRLEQNPEFIANPGFHCRWCGYRREIGGPCQF